MQVIHSLRTNFHDWACLKVALLGFLDYQNFHMTWRRFWLTVWQNQKIFILTKMTFWDKKKIGKKFNCYVPANLQNIIKAINNFFFLVKKMNLVWCGYSMTSIFSLFLFSFKSLVFWINDAGHLDILVGLAVSFKVGFFF